MWKDVMKKEMSSLHKSDTWELIKLPKEEKIIDCKWAYTKKQGSLQGGIVRYKVGLVAKGHA